MTIKPLPPARQGNPQGVVAAVVLWKRREREGMRGRRLGSLVQASLEWRVLGVGRRWWGARPLGVRPAGAGAAFGDRSAFEGASAAAWIPLGIGGGGDVRLVMPLGPASAGRPDLAVVSCMGQRSPGRRGARLRQG
jgi:hypothetical protein